MDMMAVADPDAVHAVRSFIKKQLALQLKKEFLTTVGFWLSHHENHALNIGYFAAISKLIVYVQVCLCTHVVVVVCFDDAFI